MRLNASIAAGAVLPIFLASPPASAATVEAVQVFMEEYETAFNAGNAGELALRFYGVPLTHITDSGTRVLSSQNEVEAYIKSLIDSLKVREGTTTSIEKLEICRLGDTHDFVRAWAERRHATGETSRFSYVYLLHEHEDQLRIVSMFPVVAQSRVGCASSSSLR